VPQGRIFFFFLIFCVHACELSTLDSTQHTVGAQYMLVERMKEMTMCSLGFHSGTGWIVGDFYFLHAEFP
jgi:hypothetical protein